MSTTDTHEAFMRRALDLARLGMGTTRPNPMVGAVIVRDSRIVGEGYHERAGGPHAEVAAIKDAGDAARGATMYVTLEPCNHHGRTPPCTLAIRDAGIKTVYYASSDPNPDVAGDGAEYLRAAGVNCFSGPMSEEADSLNRGFFKWIKTGRPWIVAKFAASLDGRIATRTGESQWITGPEARQRGHELRREVDAILVGVGTVIADDPRLTVRGVERRTSNVERHPVRIVLDARGGSPLGSKIFAPDDEHPTLVATTNAAPQQWRQSLEKQGVDVSILPSDEQDRIDSAALVDELGLREIQSLLVEGGPTVHGSFFDQGLVDEVYAFIAPIVIGGTDAPGAVGGLGISWLSDAIRLDQVNLEHLGEDLLVRGVVVREKDASHSIDLPAIESHE